MSKQPDNLQPTAPRPRTYTTVVVALSVAVYLVVAALFYMPANAGLSHLNLKVLPMINAILNTFTTIFLGLGLYYIKRKEIEKHRRAILAAFGTTTLFLLTYVTYHALSESTRYGGEGILRSIYLFVLLTHVVLAVVIVPLALFSLGSGWNMDVARHRKVAKWTMPLWLYVSVTGVLVYLMIRPYY